MASRHFHEPWQGQSTGQVPTGEMPSSMPPPSDPKLHVPHTQTLRSRILDPIILTYRQARVSQVPVVVTAVIALLAFTAGSWVQTAGSLPAPDGPQVTITSSATRKTMMLGSNGEAVTSKRTDPLQTEDFERFALSASGFEKARPALSPTESGDAAMHVVPFQTVSWYPRITYYPGFIDKTRCEQIIALAKRHLAPSALAYRPGDSIPETQNVRTSSGTFLSREMDQSGALAWLEERIAAVTHMPVENGEAFNALRYMATQHYDSHYDTFSEKEYGKQFSQRIATFLLFLSDVEEGGETVFKREGRDNANRTITDWRTCADGVGVKVKPKQGDAVLFWSLTPDMKLDDHALHGACPVVKGEKWSIAKWIHEKPMGAPRH